MKVWQMGWLLAMCALGGCALRTQDEPVDAPPCVTYCTYAFTTCINAQQLYADWDDCTAHCDAFATTGQAGDTNGNTLQCRLTYIELAAQAPVAFCLNAGPDGGTDCI